eukprot:3281030-Rhodomonas_salina.1
MGRKPSGRMTLKRDLSMSACAATPHSPLSMRARNSSTDAGNRGVPETCPGKMPPPVPHPTSAPLSGVVWSQEVERGRGGRRACLRAERAEEEALTEDVDRQKQDHVQELDRENLQPPAVEFRSKAELKAHAIPNSQISTC